MKQERVEPEFQGNSWEGSLCFEVEGDSEGVFVGKHGRTFEAPEILLNWVVNRRVKELVRVVLDVGGYRKRRMDSLGKLAGRLSERAKREGKTISVCPLNVLDRRIIHMGLQEDPLVKTESIGEVP